METNHKAVQCNIKDCKEEAGYWLPDYVLETFYLCPEHAEELTGEDMESLNIINRQGEIKNIELGIYSCSEDCQVCN